MFDIIIRNIILPPIIHPYRLSYEKSKYINSTYDQVYKNGSYERSRITSVSGVQRPKYFLYSMLCYDRNGAIPIKERSKCCRV
jgi:hypothetical protein